MKLLLLLLAAIGATSGQYTKYKICATPTFTSQCNILQRGTSDVSCVYVQDSIECALLIRNNTVQFGVFSTESTLLLAKLEWDLVAVKELRHVERNLESVDYSSVVLVKKPSFKGGLQNLKGSSFCHPGYHYSRTQRWSEAFLKEFERNVAPAQCNSVKDGSIEELEVKGLLNFFSVACRPGKWSNNYEEDLKLKSRYPSLCALCENTSQCAYTSIGSEHKKALECLKTKGEVTYVALSEAQDFIKENSDQSSQYQYLCPNGTVQSSMTERPCTWLQQPWPAILTNRDNSIALDGAIPSWLAGGSQWEEALKEILTSGSMVVKETSIQSITNYFTSKRPIPLETDLCNTKITWCTSSILENEKCSIARAGGVTSGVYPLVECRSPNQDVVRCLSDIANDKADFMGIDSNYGYIARNNFNLTAAMYAETDDTLYSKVVILIKEGSNINKFEDLRSRKACFPEFGGIASIAFVDVGRSRGLFSKNECNYGKLLASYFSDSCAPGAKDVLHDQRFRQSSPEAESLCKLCDSQSLMTPRAFDAPLPDEIPSRRRRQIQATGYCSPTRKNRYFGTRGALQCFHEVGEVAVVEVQKLRAISEDLKLDTSKYSIMCRDGSVIPANNFDIPLDCPLVTIVDGEVVIKRGSGKQKGVVSALNSFDRYFNLNGEPSFRLYDKYDGAENLLFEESTVGLVSTNASKFGPSVENYIRLFDNVENCQQGNNAVGRNVVSLSFLLIALAVAVFGF